ncbi:MAG: hypothetical protein SFU57_11855 [Gemmatimonadales bacterium]|nr:hypothetical protein [Gemmatimonadales bacterium]
MPVRCMIVPRSLALLALAVVSPNLLPAQEKPTPDNLREISGTWRLNESSSEPMAGPATVLLPRQVADTEVINEVSTRGTGGGSGRGGSRGGTDLSSATAAAIARATTTAGVPPSGLVGDGGGRSRGGQSPYMRQLMAQLQAPPTLIIRAEAAMVELSVPEGQPTQWPTTGKKRQKAQLDGTLLEFNGFWERGKLTVIDAISGTGELKREFHVVKKGEELEVKYSLSGSGLPRKIERKVVYARVE